MSRIIFNCYKTVPSKFKYLLYYQNIIDETLSQMIRSKTKSLIHQTNNETKKKAILSKNKNKNKKQLQKQIPIHIHSH